MVELARGAQSSLIVGSVLRSSALCQKNGMPGRRRALPEVMLGFSLLLAFSFSYFFGRCLVLVCPEGFFRVVVGTARAVSNTRNSCLLQLVFTERNSQETLGF